MLRQNRWSIRISSCWSSSWASFGLWYATTFWQPALDTIDSTAYAKAIDWVEALAGIGEQAIQICCSAQRAELSDRCEGDR